MTLRQAIAFAFGTVLFPFSFCQSQEASGGGTKANLDLPFSASGGDEEEEEAPEIVVFFGQQYEGDGVFFCCDKSGSMREGGKWGRLQSEVLKNLSGFSERCQFGIIFFDREIVKFPQAGKPADATPAMKSAASSFLKSVQIGRGTCTLAAMLATLTMAQQSTAKRKVIILLSDGEQFCQGHDNAEYAKQCLADVTQRNTQRIQINTICIGQTGAVNEDFMRKMATLNGGQFARIIQ